MNQLKSRKRKQRLAISFLTLIVTAILMMGFSTAMGKTVTLDIDGKKTEVFTYADDVKAFLKAEHIELKENQTLAVGPDDKLEDKMVIGIISAKSYNIKDGKTLRVVEANGKTVGDVIKALGIKLNRDDIVKPALNTPGENSMTITIDRVTREVVNNETPIAFKTVTKNNDNLPKGEKKVIQEGIEGLRVDSVENVYINGELKTTNPIKSEVVKNPVDRIEEVGTKVVEEVKAPKNAPKDMSVKKVIVMQATAYDPTAGSLTAIGTKARVGAVAVDPRVIPLGSKLYIESMDGFPSYGYAVAEDTGGAIKGNRIDLFYNTNAQANNFGRRNVKVYVLN